MLVPPRDTRNDARAPRRGVDQHRVEPDGPQLGLDVLGSLGLAVAAAPAVVRRVEPDEVAGDARGAAEGRAVGAIVFREEFLGELRPTCK